MNHLEILKKQLLKELKNNKKTLASTRIARDNSPTAMESRSDESRTRLESEVAMHELRLLQLNDFIDSIPKNIKGTEKINLWSLVKIDLPNGGLQVAIVPEGLGGTKVKEIQYISDKTPIGSALIGKKVGEEFTFNDTKGRVISIS